MTEFTKRRTLAAGRIALLAGAYVALARLGFAMDAVGGFATFVWPPAGVALAAVLMRGRLWPGVALGAFFANLSNGAPVVVAAAVGVGNTLAALGGALMAKRLAGFRGELDRPRGVLGFVGIAAPLGATISATVGVASLVAGRTVPASLAVETWRAWCFGDFSGILLITPLALTWARVPRALLAPRRLVEAAGLLVVLVVASFFVFFGVGWPAHVTPFWEPYLLYLVLLWAALRFGQQGATGAVFLAAAIAVWGTAAGHGPARRATLHESLAALQAFMAVLAVTALFLGAVIVQLQRVSEERADLLRAAQARADVSEHRRALQADLLDQSNDAVVVWELGGGIVYWNDGAEQLFGFTSGEALGRVTHDLLGTELPNGLPPASIDAALARGERWEGELLHRRRDGRTIRVESRHVLGRYGDGPALVLETSRDVTARKDAEAEREHLLESERAARALAEREARSKDEFVATLSHELRTPLTAILGWAGMLRGCRLDVAASARAIETIERNARAQMVILEDLLDTSRILSGKLRLDVQRTELAEVVENAVASLQPAASAKRIRIEKEIDPATCPVEGDSGRLQQIVWNLVGNAVKFTPSGGLVRVTLRGQGSCADVIVSDDGPGIPGDFLPHVFERFRQADASRTRRHGGLGLGLALVRYLVEAHGGTVDVASEGEGRGATFTVRLPLAHARGPRQGIAAPASRESLKGIKVLLVDDDADVRDLVRRMLVESEASVVAVGSAAEALHEVPRFHPDVLLSDIGMPVQDGYQLLRALRALGPDEGGSTPAAALTAFARPEDRQQALSAGYQMHVAKPVDPAELFVVVASLAAQTAR
jgi:PAS domain S-box-containing protein